MEKKITLKFFLGLVIFFDFFFEKMTFLEKNDTKTNFDSILDKEMQSTSPPHHHLVDFLPEFVFFVLNAEFKVWRRKNYLEILSLIR